MRSMSSFEKPRRALDGIPWALAPDSSSAQVEPSARALAHLQSEFKLVERALRIERERVAELADSWGHHDFASFLREEMARDGSAGS